MGSAPPKAPRGSEADYEERRKQAEALFEAGKPGEAVALLEQLAADLAGSGNFPLAVAVRHQIHRWVPELSEGGSVAAEAEKMAIQRDQSGNFRRPSPVATPDPAITKLMEASPLLAELAAPEIAGLMESTGLMTFAKEATVIEEGSAGEELYIVTRGLLNVITKGAGGNRVRVGTLGVGDFFGEVGLLTGKPRAATVTAETDAECLRITGASWKILSEKHPRLTQLLDEAMKVRAALSAEAVLDDLRKRRGEA